MQPRRPTHDQQIAADMAALDRMPVYVVGKAPPTCSTCQHFEPDAINPPAGLGDCLAGNGAHYPHQRHLCASHRETR